MAQNPFGPGSDDDNPFEALHNMLGPQFAEMFKSGDMSPEALSQIDPAELAKNFPGGQAAFASLMGQVQSMMSASGDDAVNWSMAEDVARKTAAAAGDDHVVEPAQAKQFTSVVSLAQTWLDQATDMPGRAVTTQTWSRAEWITNTINVWQEIAGPVASAVADAMSSAVAKQAPPEMAAMLGQASGMLRTMGGNMFGMQVGQAVGKLSTEVLSGFDIGLPLAAEPALVPTNVNDFMDGLSAPADDVRLYLVMREAAHHRLFSHVTWLKPHLMDAVAAFARGISIDTDRIDSAIATVDPNDMDALNEALSGGLLEPAKSPEQVAALGRLELLLALIEGWVDHVVHTAVVDRLPSASALRETMRRRRAAGGPAEDTLAALVGLQLRPRKLRESAALWAALEEAEEVTGRDSFWSHFDLLPKLEDLDDPKAAVAALIARRDGTEVAPEEGSDSSGTDWDAALAGLLDGNLGDAPVSGLDRADDTSDVDDATTRKQSESDSASETDGGSSSDERPDAGPGDKA